MARRIVILDYGSGNLRSAERALQRVGADVEVTSDKHAALEAEGLVVPGVGAFAACMEGLRQAEGDKIIDRRLAGGRPVLGICVGMQVMFERGVEHGVQAEGCGQWPGAVERLVLVSSIGRMTYSRARGLLMGASTLVPFKLFVAANIRRAFGPGHPRDEVQKYIRASASTPREVVMTLYAAMRAFDVLDRAGEIRVPTLMVHGYHDVQLPVRQMLRLATGYQDAEIRVLDAGHELPLERPEGLTAVLDRFLARP